ncbi:hypothetical protein WJX81_003040 [Elliptochloris bilobata]|uniref:Interferon-related developmental regulator N-terminal domain-containing protein n=1 Tax=Elliptochloris bilobata TaxID=381761 RepID=A0AAW1RTD4_9CHLO
MAKKKGSSRRLRGDTDSTDGDTLSSVSASTLASLRDDFGDEDLADEHPLERLIDALYEKRASTRERALEALAAFLESSYLPDDILDRRDTLLLLFVRSVRSGGAAEAAMAARALALLAINLGAGDASERVFCEARPALEKVAAAGSRAASARIAAVEALAVLAFIAGEEPDDVEGVLTLLAALWGVGAPAVVAAALRGWALVASTLPGVGMGAEWVERSLAGLEAGLHAGDVDVRGAAGEAIALLYHAAGLAAADASGEDDLGSPGPATPPLAGEDGGARAAGMEDVVARMRDLATNRGDASRRSKRERASLRSTFRGLCAAVEGGDAGETRVKLRHGDVLVVDTRAGRVQLDALRRLLGQGFQPHLLHNPLLHQVFNFEPRGQPSERLTRLEKRMFRSPAAEAVKSRQVHRARDRANTAAYKGAMLAAEKTDNKAKEGIRVTKALGGDVIVSSGAPLPEPLEDFWADEKFEWLGQAAGLLVPALIALAVVVGVFAASRPASPEGSARITDVAP